ncbi:MAG TPA: alpha-L-fucosidase [Puia sp.]|nr:alpha-L-fucosidase [Puia sp.]
MKYFSLIFLLTISLLVNAQNNYVPPTDTLVQKKIEQWQDLKFGLFMHWGTYSEWGIVESWSLCPEDEGWTQRRGQYAQNYFEYKKAYENLQTTFNPQNFHPEKWVEAAKDAGMKYVVFTTKHHDGFCMFDTKETDYKITSSKTPFSSNPRSNVAKEIFNAFRKENFLIGAYFSKPDWHTENYWWPYFPPKDRNVNYDPKKYPEKWNAFKQFTFNQIKELMSGYGKMDILWLDGGWVRPLSTVDKNVEWQKGIVYDQDIDMKNIAAMGRSLQPGLIVVDRSVGGEFENYQTPEQEVPEKPLSFPWETCMTMGNSWSFVPNDHYKSAQQLVQLLVKVVSRGGNFLLNIGPGPDGDWDPTAYQRLKDVGAWMKINGEGIYNSKPIAPYSSDNIFFTQSKDGKNIYAFYLSEKDEATIPAQIKIANLTITPKSKIQILGTNEKLKWKQEGANLIINIPAKMQNNVAGKYAVTLKINQ